MLSKRVFLFTIGFCISAIIIIFMLLYADFGIVVQYIAGANPFFLVIVFYFVVTMLMLKSLRWFLILRSADIDVSVGDALKSFLGGSVVSVFTPGRIGEPVRVYFLKKVGGQNMSKTLSPIFMERAMDFLVMLMFIAAGLIFFAISFTQQVFTFSILAVAFAVIIIVVIVMILKRRVGTFFMNRLSRRMKILRKININMFYDTMDKISIRSIAGFFLLTILVWLMEAGILFFGILSVGVWIPLNICIFVLCAAMMIGTLSFLPGSLGSFEASAVILAMVFVAAPVSAITGGVFMYSIVSYLVIILMGLLSIISIRKN